MAKKLWFRAKRYGYGWYPSSWEGLLVLVIYLGLVLFTFRMVDIKSHSVSDTLIGVFVPFIVLTIILIFVCCRKGERARWRWG